VIRRALWGWAARLVYALALPVIYSLVVASGAPKRRGRKWRGKGPLKLPPLAGASPESTTIRLDPAADTATIAWTKKAGATNHYEEVAQPSAASGGSAPSTAKGLTVTSASAVDEWRLPSIQSKLPVGATLTKVTSWIVFCYGKSATAESFSFTTSWANKAFASTTSAWEEKASVEGNFASIATGWKGEEHAALKGLKAKISEVNCLYVLVGVEYESASETKTVALAAVRGAGASRVSSQSVRLGTPVTRGAGQLSASGFQLLGFSSPAARGAGRLSATGYPFASSAAVARGAGRLAAVGYPFASGRAEARGAGRSTSAGFRKALGSPAVRGGGDVFTVKIELEIKIGSPAVHGGGAIKTSGYPFASGSASTRGGGRASAAGFRIAAGSPRATGAGASTVNAYRLVLAVIAARGGGSSRVTGLKVALAAVRLTGGGNVSVTARRIARGVASVSGGGRVSAVMGGPQRVAVRGGGSVTAVGEAVSFTIAFPEHDPVEGHASVGELGRITKDGGKIAFGSVGRRN
jgi:hypothetical protein